MSSHELAKKLLEGPDVPVAINDACGTHYELDHVSMEDGPNAWIELKENDYSTVKPHIQLW